MKNYKNSYLRLGMNSTTNFIPIAEERKSPMALPSSSLPREENIGKSLPAILLDMTLIFYSTFLAGTVLGGGAIIRLYGNTCGIDIFDPMSYLWAFIAVGSPWCKALNWLSYSCSAIVEQIWYHLATLLFTMVLRYAPRMEKKIS